MTKIRSIFIKLSLLMGLIVTLLPFPAYAQENSGEINIIQSDIDTGETVGGISLSLHKVAEKDGNGKYQLTPEFKDSLPDVDKLFGKESIQSDVEALDEYVSVKGIAPKETKVTESDGKIQFSNLSDGLYFIRQSNTEEDFEKLGYTYKTDSYLVELPRTDEDGNITRVVNCRPKGKLKRPDETIDLTVYKIWKDESDKAGKRPEEISVGLYMNGSLKETVVLSAKNNWTHQWKSLDKGASWSVKELNVPDGYSSEISNGGTSYTIVNTCKPPVTPDNPPGKGTKVNTGDHSPIIPYCIAFVICMSILGTALLYRRKNRK